MSGNIRYNPSRAWQTDKTYDEIKKEQQAQNIVANQERIWKLKLGPCADCKLRWHPSVMTFDHIDRRSVTKNKAAKNINSVLYYNPDMFSSVLRHMSVVCMNCHFVREMRRDLNDPKYNKRKRDEIIALFEQLTRGALMQEVKI